MNFSHFGDSSSINSGAVFISPEKISIGNHVTIEDGCLIDATYGEFIHIGDHVTVKRGSILIASGNEFPNGFIDIKPFVHVGFYNILNGHAGLTIGEHTLLGPMIHLNGYSHHFDRKDKLIKDQGGKADPIFIGTDVYVCSGSTVLGCRIGEGAVIGAHSLVRHDVAPYTVVGGVPAVKIRDRGNEPD